MTALTINAAQRRDLRAQAHHLDPVVMIGAEGLTAAVTKETDAALKAHGLIKVRAAIDDRAARDAAFVQLCHELEGAPVQHIGKLFIVWRPMPEKLKERAEDAKPGPRLVTLVKASKNKNNRPKVSKIKLLGNQRITAGGIVKRAKPKQKSSKPS
jgi:putative YhbY family RNA-binding protein